MTTDSVDRSRAFHYMAPTPEIANKTSIMFDTIGQTDFDADLTFQLRGHSINALVDAAMPLFGLVIRLRKLKDYEKTSELLVTVRDQISAIDEEIRRYDYDAATQLAYRYSLCSFVDDAVMGTPWGATSSWSERSLLSIFHNETWGGEKFFTVLARMQMEPGRYRDVLEFKYLCLCLGFKGKYGLQHNQTETLNAIITKLHHTLRSMRGETPEQLTDPQTNVVSQRYRLSRQLPLWTPWAVAIVVLTGVFAFFAFSLNDTTGLVLRSLESILKP